MESLCSTTETNIMFYVNYISIFKKRIKVKMRRTLLKIKPLEAENP